MSGDACPKCGGETTFGYGLMGGGMGAYRLCMADDCDWFHKDRECLYCDGLQKEGSLTCGEAACVAKDAEATNAP